MMDETIVDIEIRAAAKTALQNNSYSSKNVQNILTNLKKLEQMQQINSKENQVAIVKAGDKAGDLLHDFILLHAVAKLAKNDIWESQGIGLMHRKKPQGIRKILQVLSAELNDSQKIDAIQEIAGKRLKKQFNTQGLSSAFYASIVRKDYKEIEKMIKDADPPPVSIKLGPSL